MSEVSESFVLFLEHFKIKLSSVGRNDRGFVRNNNSFRLNVRLVRAPVMTLSINKLASSSTFNSMAFHKIIFSYKIRVLDFVRGCLSIDVLKCFAHKIGEIIDLKFNDPGCICALRTVIC